MTQERYDTLIDKLTNSTELGKIKWEQTSSKDEYQTKIGDNAISVGYFDPNNIANILASATFSNNKNYYYLNIYNSKGVQVDTEERVANEAGYIKLRNLYQAAKRKYNKVDETLDEILDVLG